MGRSSWQVRHRLPSPRNLWASGTGPFYRRRREPPQQTNLKLRLNQRVVVRRSCPSENKRCQAAAARLPLPGRRRIRWGECASGSRAVLWPPSGEQDVASGSGKGRVDCSSLPGPTGALRRSSSLARTTGVCGRQNHQDAGERTARDVERATMAEIGSACSGGCLTRLPERRL